ncbi:PilW family protein [Sporosarcina cascadiensis]|uniref:PilW family protein n=1 Tax=Sporosarcina cascadiensis TaxID=2660747 RepID=UPI00129B41FB|nr:hypothetical protein [Sporosarcina cascadiensis]
MVGKQLIKKSLRSQVGVTLVELLAVLVILSSVGILVFSLYFTGQKEYEIQEERTTHQQSIQYVFKYITKEIRRKNNFNVNNDNVLLIGNDKYEKVGNILYKNDEILADNIESFLVTPISAKTVHIEIKSKEKYERNYIKAETTITTR